MKSIPKMQYYATTNRDEVLNFHDKILRNHEQTLNEKESVTLCDSVYVRSPEQVNAHPSGK